MNYLFTSARIITVAMFFTVIFVCFGCQALKRESSETSIPVVRLSPEGSFCSIGCNDVSPESPDGTKIVYTKWDPVPTSSKGGSGSIWYCNRDLTGHTKIIDFKSITIHNGAAAAWVDNNRIQMRCLDYNGVRGAAVVNINGTVEFGPYSGKEVLHDSVNGKVLLCDMGPKSKLGEGIFILDCTTKEIKKICDGKSFLEYTQKIDELKDRTVWGIQHSTLSKDGTYIALCLANKEKSPWLEYLVTFDTSFNDVVIFGKKPMHFNWYDDRSSIYGNDREAKGELYNSIRRWGRDGKWIEDLASAPSTHNAMSPDKKFFAGESNYMLPVTDLYIHKRNEGSIKIMSHSFKNVTWDMRAHVNPAFSRDGKRLYYNRATSDAMNEVWYADLSGL